MTEIALSVQRLSKGWTVGSRISVPSRTASR